MDWPLEDPGFCDEDLDSVFLYEPRRSKAIYRFAGDKDITECWLETDLDVSRWLEEVNNRQSTPGLAVILASRAEQPNIKHNPAILEYLPFSKKAFENITANLPLHGDTARIINRSDMAFYTDINLLNTPTNAIFHLLRTSSTYPTDLALSSVSHPTGFTAALVFGCTPSLTTSITNRLANTEPSSLTHPLLLTGILAELERARHLALVQQRVFHLLQRVRALSRSGSQHISATSALVGENYSVDLWIEVWQLRTALEGWMGELRKVEAGCDEVVQLLGLKEEWGDGETGKRIQRRLGEIRGEYEGKIRECSMVIEGMALSAQLSWNQIGYQDTQANLKIATDTRQDSNQMRSIAFLTMFFLPATFLASLFSMTFFNWSAAEGEAIVSPYVWIYPVLTISITLAVLGCWFFFTRRRRVSVDGWDETEKLSV